jgi:phosphoglycolate phosphatase-like HAD superfamily hydrolase
MKKIDYSQWAFIWDLDGTLIQTTEDGVNRVSDKGFRRAVLGQTGLD